LNKTKAHEITLSHVTQRREQEGNMGSSTKTSMTPEKNKGKEKVLKPKEKLSEHIDFHLFLKLNGEVHSLINLLNGPKIGKGGKHALKYLKVDEFQNMQKEANPKVDQTSKEFLAFLDAFQSFMVQQGETTTQNHEMTKLMG
jgi:heme-binding NEAT domain protein